jgi:hypothetical protein
MSYIRELEIDSRFNSLWFGVKYIATQTDSKGNPLMSIKFKGVTQNPNWFKNKIKSKKL